MLLFCPLSASPPCYFSQGLRLRIYCACFAARAAEASLANPTYPLSLGGVAVVDGRKAVGEGNLTWRAQRFITVIQCFFLCSDGSIVRGVRQVFPQLDDSWVTNLSLPPARDCFQVYRGDTP